MIMALFALGAALRWKRAGLRTTQKFNA